MTKIKTIDEIKAKVGRAEELLADVLVACFRIVDSFPPGSVVMFEGDDIVDLLGIDFDQIESALHVLEENDLLEIRGTGQGQGYAFGLTAAGKSLARELILSQLKEMEELQKEDSRENIFLIHGHDEKMKMEVFDFVSSLGLAPVILHEVEDRGRTLIEKLEHELKKARFAVSLWSPDDLMPDGSVRARQNVILETGMFCNELSRKGVRILMKGNVAVPSDLDGVLRSPYDESGRWQRELQREMLAAGIKIKKP